ncbi:hypothetical protein DPMN_098864 [Dreissena polymorpha]|uniref:Uncharacterized protein n=1 Tax=Dreissena polymorpha TaxID=45954 RepID=A0A9D4LEG1_DREPO|nr:hypothetical protein DPMN_098864 [Dreissena polymorpha]
MNAGILGYDVYIDRQGDAEGNYTLLTFDVHQPDSKVELIPVGNFRMTQGGVGIPVCKHDNPKPLHTHGESLCLFSVTNLKGVSFFLFF